MKVSGPDAGVLPVRVPSDVGLQPERTALAWNRTGLVMLANGMLALQTGWSASQTVITTVAFGLLFAAGVICERDPVPRSTGSVQPSAPGTLPALGFFLLQLRTAQVSWDSILTYFA